MRQVRILIVDDVAIVRRLVRDALAADPELQVVGEAADGIEALDKLPALRPDLLVLDYEMPGMNGLETLRQVRRTHPGVRVILFSTHTRYGAKLTLDALWMGADDYATKITANSPAEAMRCVQSELVPKIKALCADPAPGTGEPVHASPRASAGPAGAPAQRAEILAIGASTGGPKALATILETLPPDLPIPIVVVQHMPALFTRSLAERISSSTPHRGAEAADGTPLAPGTVWIAPGDRHLVLERHGVEVRLVTNSDPPENSCRPSVDPLFRSVAEIYGAGALGLVLTGMGQDGLRGARRIRDAGGRILVQDEPTSVVWGMPGAVARAGLADAIVPIGGVAAEIVRLASGTRSRRATVA